MSKKKLDYFSVETSLTCQQRTAHILGIRRASNRFKRRQEHQHMLMLLFPKHWKMLTSILELRETIRWWDVRSSIGNWSIHQLNEGSPSGLQLVGTVEGSMPTSLATRRQSSFKDFDSKLAR
jgi:hypothetical protein